MSPAEPCKVLCFAVKRGELEIRLDVGFNNPLVQKRPNTVYECTRIDEIATTYNGGTPSKSEPLYWGGTIPWISPKDFSDITISISEDHITEKAIVETGLRLLPIGTVLVVYRSGVLLHTLPVAVAKTKVTINQDIKALLLDKRVQPEYLALYLHVFEKKLLPIITKHSTTVQSINSQQFNALLIPIPPLPIQQEMVGIMESARESRRRKLEQADALVSDVDTFFLARLGLTPQKKDYSHFFGARLDDAWSRCDPDFHSPKFKGLREAIEHCGHPVLSLNAVCISIKSGFAAGREIQAFDEIHGIPHIRPLNISPQGELGFEGTKYVPKDSVAESEIIQKGEVLLNNTNSTEWVGKTAVFDSERACCCSNHITRLVVDRDKVLPWYLAGFFNAVRSTGYLGLIATNFVNQAGINTETLSALRLPIPDLKTQQEIINELHRRRLDARRLREEATAKWGEAKAGFEVQLLGSEANQ